MDGPATTLSLVCAGFAKAANEEPPAHLIELLVACETSLTDTDFLCSLLADTGATSPAISVEQIGADGTIFHEDYETWKAESSGFLSLSGRPGYGKLNYARLIIDLKSVFDPKHPPFILQLSWRDQASHAGHPLLIGAIKFLSIEELHRFETQNAYNDHITDELESFLKPPLVPVLDPGSKYEVTVTWSTTGRDISAAAGTSRFRFLTTDKPPPLLAPYLLATFPAADEQLHPYSHQPGFSISSGDILRILQKYPGLRLKISVVEDGNNPVAGKDAKGNKLDWTTGQLYDPALLLDVLADTPGVDRKWFNALPSPLLRALKSAIAAGKLQCLDNSIKLDQGQWIGIMVDLEPLLGYTIRVDLARADGQVWSLAKDGGNADPPFLQWHFRTGVQANLKEQRELFARPIARRRTLLPLLTHPADDFARELDGLSRTVEVCDEYRDCNLDNTEAPAASIGKVALIADQALEDALTRWLGERPTLSSETEKTILWEGAGSTLLATAIVLRSREPMLRRTQTAKIERVDTDAGSADVLKLDWIITRFPSLAKSKGIKALYVSSSGTCAVAILDPARNDRAPIVIAAEEYAPHYLPYEGASGAVDLIEIAAGALKR